MWQVQNSFPSTGSSGGCVGMLGRGEQCDTGVSRQPVQSIVVEVYPGSLYWGPRVSVLGRGELYDTGVFRQSVQLADCLTQWLETFSN